MSRFERAGYAGALTAAKNQALASRFRFWCGGSGRRYAVSVYAPDKVPPYDLAVSLYVKQTAEGPQVIALSAGLANEPAPAGTDEVHVHVVERVEALAFAHRDLRALIEAGAAALPKQDKKAIRFYPRYAA